METEEPSNVTKLRLDVRDLALAVAPAAVLVLSDIVLNRYGWPLESETRFVGEFNAHAEAAARFRLVAAFLVFVGAAVAAFVFFVRLLRLLDVPSIVRVGLASIALVACVGAYFYWLSPQETQEFTDQRIYCAAASAPAKIQLGDPAAADPNDLERGPSYLPDNCAAERFALLRELISGERLLLVFAIPAVVFGAITALGRRPAPAAVAAAGAADRDASFAAGEATPAEAASARSPDAGSSSPQGPAKRGGTAAHRLNLVLYLSAFLLVGGLLFLSAFLHMPLHFVEPEAATDYRARVHAIVLFYGVSYSLLIAAFYIPVAVRLEESVAAPAAAAVEEDGGSAADKPLALHQLLRIAAAIFSPLIVALLGDVINLPI